MVYKNIKEIFYCYTSDRPTVKANQAASWAGTIFGRYVFKIIFLFLVIFFGNEN
jgi:hypothetical protein